MKQLTWILAACAGVIAAGCGQKGPLVLPDKNAKVITRPGGSRTTTPATPPPEQPPPGQTAPAQSPQDSAPQPPPGPTSQGPDGATKPPSDKSDDSQSKPTPRN
jgi:predicted small lipoprotein YifL